MLKQKEAWIYFIEILYKNNKFEEVVKACEDALVKNTKLKEAWYYMGISQYKLSKFEQAEYSSVKALEINDKYINDGILVDRDWIFININP